MRLNELIKRHSGLGGTVLFLLTVILYGGSLSNGFVYDDGLQILDNPFVRNPALWPKIFSGSVWSFQGGHTNFYRPLQIFSYWLIYRLAGANPAVFHLFQLFFYAATVWLIFRLGRELIPSASVAFAGALLWAVHPLHVEAVAWISALPDVGCGFFYLLAFLLFVRSEKAGGQRVAGHIAATVAFLPALFFKEMALSLPLLLLAYWMLMAEPSDVAGWCGRLVRWLPYCVAAAIYFAIRTAVLGYNSPAPQPWKINLQVVAAAVGLLAGHIRLFFWPTHLNVFRTFDVASSLRSPWPWITLLVLFWMLRIRRREPVLSFLVIWWPLALLPTLDIRFLSFPILAERFSYLPSVGLCLAIAFVGLLWLPRRVPSPKLSAPVLAGLAAVMVFWSSQTVRAIPHWHNNDTLVQYSAKQSPNAAVLHVVQGLVLQYQRRDLDGAVREYETALRLNRTSLRPLPGVPYDCYLSLGQIAYQRGRPEEAVRYFEKATQVIHDMSEAYDYLGTVYFPRGDYAKAAEYFSHAVKVNPYDFGARFYLGTCWVKLGQYRQAAEQFRAARDIDPTYLPAFEAEAHALETAGDQEGAARIRRLKPRAKQGGSD